ncbi:MAG: zinc ribbon domain-containing protein, partial [Chloroflexota bacterium]
QVHEDWIICPTCRNRLRRVCPNCSRLVELDWSLCAWCGKDFERPQILQDALAPVPAGRRRKPVDTETVDEPGMTQPVPQMSTSSMDNRVTEPPTRPGLPASEDGLTAQS